MSKQYDSAPDLLIDLDKSYSALLKTNHGDITIDFDPVRAPSGRQQLRVPGPRRLL